jgi:GntR family transcriptional repressor for pyruvate dehydrogenase complex
MRGEGVVARLRRDILLGRFAPGDRLPPERELATRLQTNRNTLREALRILESENLLRARQGDGTIVLDWRASGEINLLPWFLAEKTPASERFDEMLMLLSLRSRLMDEAIGRVVLCATVEDLDAIDAALEAVRRAKPGPELVAADVDLYRRVALASRSLVLIWVFNTFSKIFLELGERFPQAWSNDEKYLAGLTRTLRWLRERRVERAREEMRQLFEVRSMELAGNFNPDGGAVERPRKARRRS